MANEKVRPAVHAVSRVEKFHATHFRECVPAGRHCEPLEIVETAVFLDTEGNVLPDSPENKQLLREAQDGIS